MKVSIAVSSKTLKTTNSMDPKCRVYELTQVAISIYSPVGLDLQPSKVTLWNYGRFSVQIVVPSS